MTLQDAILQSRKSQSKIANAVGMSAAAMCRLVKYGEYPTRRDQKEIRARVSAVLALYGVSPDEIDWPKPGIRPDYGQGTRREEITGAPLERHASTREITREDIELMQLDRNVLALFGLRTNPFLNDVEDEEDVFRSKGYQYVTDAIRDAIEQRGFIAISAESGAGKTTIWDGIESEYAARPDVIICKPQIKSKEALTPDHLCRALLYGLLGDDCRVANDGEARGRQLSAALRAVRTGAIDRKAVLYIDDAHFCNASVLRQLKTFFEEKVGRFRLLTIVLVGLPQLKAKLAAFSEIGNRIRLVEVPPVPVKEYLEFKLRRVGSCLEKLFDGGGLEAFVDRFRVPRRPALGQPLIVNATCIRAMVKLYENGAQAGERITREIIDQLPGAAPRRVA